MAVSEHYLEGCRSNGVLLYYPAHRSRPQFLSPAGRFAVLCFCAMFIGASVAFAT